MLKLRSSIRLSVLTLPVAILLISMAGCDEVASRSRKAGNYSPPTSTDAPIDVQEIVDRGYLTLLTENTSSSYYLYKGRPIGYDYEMVKSFCDHLGVELRVHVLRDLNEMFDLLKEGEGDIIACNLAVTTERKTFVNFTEPLMQTHQVLVQNKDNELIRNVVDLKGRDVFVHPYSSFYSRLENLEREIGGQINIHPVNGAIDSEKMIKLVAQGDIDLTVADNNLAQLNSKYFKEIDIKTQISFDQDVAWAVRKSSPDLLVMLDDWLSTRSVKNLGAYVYKKYYKHTNTQKNRVSSPYSSLSGKQISKYDEIIKRESQSIGWDWRLLAALIYQESRFDPEAKSWVGAFGLMQLMPETAERFGIDTLQTEASNIAAGVRYIAYLEKFWAKRIENKRERRKFILASYNVGPGHVLDAQRLAEHLGKDPLVWEGNVDECLLLKSEPEYYNLDFLQFGYCRGSEPFAYVKEILQNYQQYRDIN